MAVVAQTFAVIAALVHVAVFVAESLAFDRPAVQRLFGQSEPSAKVKLWAFNQGFYNLFLAVGAIVGVALWASGNDTAGRTLVIYTCACMAAAGVVLYISDRRLWRRTLIQSVPPLVGLLAAVAA